MDLIYQLAFKDKVLSFLNSFLSSRSQKVFIDGEYSMPRTIKTGVPQGSILGPVLFSCYLVPLEVLFERLYVNYHFYADDTVICFVYHASINQGAFDLILTTLQKWFSGAKLQLNSNKTEYMFVSRKNSLNCDIELPTDANFANNVTLLGFTLDSRLSYAKQVSSVCRRCYYFLREIYSIRDTVDRKSLIELVRVMILSRLDYCNSLYYGLPVNIIQKLQRIMNSACRLIFRLSPGSPTANYIKELHWLPMKQRILYKILFFGHRLVNHPWKMPMYLGALVFRIDKVTRCQ